MLYKIRGTVRNEPTTESHAMNSSTIIVGRGICAFFAAGINMTRYFPRCVRSAY